jgi:hypothetical protein
MGGSVSERFMETEKLLTKSLYSYHLTNKKPNKLNPEAEGGETSSNAKFDLEGT